MGPPPPGRRFPKTFRSNQCLEPNLVALPCLEVERAMGIEPTGKEPRNWKTSGFLQMLMPSVIGV